LVTVADHDKEAVLPSVRKLADMGFRVMATTGTAAYLESHGVASEVAKKLYEGRPHILDALHNQEVAMVINTPAGKASVHDDSYIRKAAIRYKIPYVTTPAAAAAAAEGIRAARERVSAVKSLQQYHEDVVTLG